MPTTFTTSAAKDLTAAADTLAVNMDGKGQFNFLHKGTFAGATVTIEGSPNSTNGIDGDWYAVNVVQENGTSVSTTPLSNSASSVGVWGGNASWATFIRARVTALTSGTISAMLVGSTSDMFDGSIGVHPVTMSGTWTVTATPVAGIAYSLTAAATANLALIVNTSTRVMELTCFNPTAATIYVKLFNKATAPVAADVPVVTIPVAAGALVAIEFGTTGKQFATGLGIAVTANPEAGTATALPTAGAQISLTRV